MTDTNAEQELNEKKMNCFAQHFLRISPLGRRRAAMNRYYHKQKKLTNKSRADAALADLKNRMKIEWRKSKAQAVNTEEICNGNT